MWRFNGSDCVVSCARGEKDFITNEGSLSQPEVNQLCAPCVLASVRAKNVSALNGGLKRLDLIKSCQRLGKNDLWQYNGTIWLISPTYEMGLGLLDLSYTSCSLTT